MEEKEFHVTYKGGQNFPSALGRKHSFVKLRLPPTTTESHMEFQPEHIESSFRGKTKHPFLNRFFINVAVLH